MTKHAFARPVRRFEQLQQVDLDEFKAEILTHEELFLKLAGDLPGIDGVYCVGPLMRHLYELVPAERALGWHEDPATLDPREIAALLQGGDVVVVKGSKKMFWVNKFVPRLLAALQAKA